MKINILFTLDKYGGGGNQFLTALKKQWQKSQIYVDDPKISDVILLNSHHYLLKAAQIKKRYPNKIFIHRIDGPVELIRGKDRATDKIIYYFNDLIADGTIFQSHWSERHNIEQGMKRPVQKEVVVNAIDKNIFYPAKIQKTHQPVRIIATTNSANWRKGFKIYKFLDDNLDFTKYALTLIGNSPIKFKNVKFVPRISITKLSEHLRQSDIYITASQNDPCSNALIEALACGLPVVALNDGGHPELIKEGGVLFNDSHDVITAINRVTKSLDEYRSKIVTTDLQQTAMSYYNFAQKLLTNAKTIAPENLTSKQYLLSMLKYNLWRLGKKFK